MGLIIPEYVVESTSATHTNVYLTVMADRGSFGKISIQKTKPTPKTPAGTSQYMWKEHAFQTTAAAAALTTPASTKGPSICNTYTMYATAYVFASKEARDTKKNPIDHFAVTQIVSPDEIKGDILAIFYANIMTTYPNATNDTP